MKAKGLSRIFVFMLAAAMSVSIFTGCGKESSSNAEIETTQVQETTQEQVSTPEQETTEEQKATSKQETSSTEETTIEQEVAKSIEDTISGLTNEYEQLKADINSYDKYIKNTDKIEAFYEKINKTNKDLCIKMREYALAFADKIISSNSSNDDKYDEIDVIYDCIYEDGGDGIYDGIYDGILEDMYDDFYDGILEEAYDNAPYDEWSDASSQEYKWWSDTSSDVYEEWSDFCSEVYEFQSDLSSAFWDDDIDEAKERIEDFKEDIDKLKNKG